MYSTAHAETATHLLPPLVFFAVLAVPSLATPTTLSWYLPAVPREPGSMQ